MTRAIVVVTAAALLACSGSATTTPPLRHGGESGPAPPRAQVVAPRPGTRRAPDLQERLVMREMQALTEGLRGQTFDHDVPMIVADRAAIIADVTAEIESEPLEESRRVYVALGLLPADLDVRALLARVLGEQVVGFYDPERRKFAVRDDIMAALRGSGSGEARLDEARVVLVHELVHALQDQRLGLGDVYDTSRDTDADNAFHALVEGDATLAMIAYAGSAAGVSLSEFTSHRDQLRAMISQSSPLPGDELGRAPAIVRVPLVSAYLDGMLFCAEMHARGGWEAIDTLHRRPPISTEQILHPEKYLTSEAPLSVSLREFDALEQQGLTRFAEDTLGELEMSVYFDLGATEEEAREAAAGWGGDRLRVYRSTSPTGTVIWASHWDTEGDAREAEASAARAARTAAPEAGHAHETMRRGRALLVARNLPRPLVSAVRAAFDRSPVP